MTDQRSLSAAISGLMPRMRMSLFSRSSHLICGRPLGLVLVIFEVNVLLVMWVSSLRITCPYHDSRFCVRTDLIGVTFEFPLMVSFLILSFLVFPWLHPNFTTPCWWYGTRYVVLDRLIFNPLFSITTLHLPSSSSISYTVSLTSTKSSANNIAQGGLVIASCSNTSMIIIIRSGPLV